MQDEVCALPSTPKCTYMQNDWTSQTILPYTIALIGTLDKEEKKHTHTAQGKCRTKLTIYMLQ